jgi:RNA polymerase sigma-70 factor, ECF subfamily
MGNERVTSLLKAWGRGDLDARNELIQILYRDLKQRAARQLRRERPGHILQPTALVHEAFLRLAGQEVRWQNRAHFLALASEMMRRVLVDHARGQKAGKRSGAWRRVSIDEGLGLVEQREIDLVFLDQCLQELAELSPTHARLVELRYFGGLTTQEAAEVLEVSQATVERRWNLARAWLYRRVTGGRASASRTSRSLDS